MGRRGVRKGEKKKNKRSKKSWIPFLEYRLLAA